MSRLQQYHKKRSFAGTPEPKAGVSKGEGALTFVVQRHKASHLHYDFRLELDGVLKSWAVPKGPSMNPADKRLAMAVEDHPYSYRTFTGIIPEGNYGAGIVEIWDSGTYECLNVPDRKKGETKLRKDLKAGSLKVVLHGKKLKGEFALVKMQGADQKNAWLLIKHNDRYAVSQKYDSEALTAASSPINKALKAKKGTRTASTKPKAEQEKNKALSRHISPMLAKETDKPFDDDDWLFEIKWDGYRAIAETGGKTPLLYSRNGINFEDKYPVIFEALKAFKTPMVLDGEVTALDDKGMPDFQQLQHYAQTREGTLQYNVFDLLYYKGKSLEHLPLTERKQLLQEVLPPSDIIVYSDHVTGSGKAFFKAAADKGMEGIMAKRADSVYTEGARTADWLKIKHHLSDDAVIIGFTQPLGSRKYFGALVLGRYNDAGVLVHTGNAGTGFTEQTGRELYDKMLPLVRKTPPANVVVSAAASITWLQPSLVAQVKYTGITTGGKFRHPVFLGLREDKKPADVLQNNPIKPMKNNKPSTTQLLSPHEADQDIKANGKTVHVTHVNKVYWPNEGWTKGDVITYYNDMAPYILPYLKNRPQSLHRTPNGIKDKGFFHKDAGDNAPDWITAIELFSESANKDINYIVCNNKATLLYLANLGCIELNPWNSRVQYLDQPDYLVMDIDPSDNNTFEQVIDVALAIKEVLDTGGIPSCCKTSGASGLHVYVPLQARYDYEQVREFARIIAMLTVQMLPGITTMERSLSKRDKNKIYLDYLQNKRGQTLAAPYCTRPVPGATVSAPLLWKEVRSGLSPAQFHIGNMLQRVQQHGDLFELVLGKGFALQKALALLQKML